MPKDCDTVLKFLGWVWSSLEIYHYQELVSQAVLMHCIVIIVNYVPVCMHAPVQGDVILIRDAGEGAELTK